MNIINTLWKRLRRVVGRRSTADDSSSAATSVKPIISLREEENAVLAKALLITGVVIGLIVMGVWIKNTADHTRDVYMKFYKEAAQNKSTSQRLCDTACKPPYEAFKNDLLDCPLMHHYCNRDDEAAAAEYAGRHFYQDHASIYSWVYGCHYGKCSNGLAVYIFVPFLLFVVKNCVSIWSVCRTVRKKRQFAKGVAKREPSRALVAQQIEFTKNLSPEDLGRPEVQNRLVSFATASVVSKEESPTVSLDGEMLQRMDTDQRWYNSNEGHKIVLPSMSDLTQRRGRSAHYKKSINDYGSSSDDAQETTESKRTRALE